MIKPSAFVAVCAGSGLADQANPVASRGGRSGGRSGHGRGEGERSPRSQASSRLGVWFGDAVAAALRRAREEEAQTRTRFSVFAMFEASRIAAPSDLRARARERVVFQKQTSSLTKIGERKARRVSCTYAGPKCVWPVDAKVADDLLDLDLGVLFDADAVLEKGGEVGGGEAEFGEFLGARAVLGVAARGQVLPLEVADGLRAALKVVRRRGPRHVEPGEGTRREKTPVLVGGSSAERAPRKNPSFEKKNKATKRTRDVCVLRGHVGGVVEVFEGEEGGGGERLGLEDASEGTYDPTTVCDLEFRWCLRVGETSVEAL